MLPFHRDKMTVRIGGRDEREKIDSLLLLKEPPLTSYRAPRTPRYVLSFSTSVLAMEKGAKGALYRGGCCHDTMKPPPYF